MAANILRLLQNDIDSSSDVMLEEVKLEKIQYLKKSNKLKIIVKSVNELNAKIQCKIKDVVGKKLGCFKDIDFIC